LLSNIVTKEMFGMVEEDLGINSEF